MHWIITRDALGDEPHVVGVGRYPGRSTFKALKDVTDEQRRAELARAIALEGVWHYEIRLFDDDGNLYYEGLAGDLDNASEGPAFAPLDWAEANAGCTYMEYRRIGTNEPWRQL